MVAVLCVALALAFAGDVNAFGQGRYRVQNPALNLIVRLFARKGLKR